MEFYSATKKNEILLFSGKWIELENTILNKVSKVQNVKPACFLSYLEYRPSTNTAIL
jgi:hypothetical protein